MPLLKRQLKYDCAELAIKKLIAERSCRVGEKIPTLQELAKALPYGEITLRHALKSMEEAGLVERRVGSGTYLCHALQYAETNSYFLYVHLRTPYKFSPVRYPAELQAYLAERGIGMRYLDVPGFSGEVAELAEKASGVIIAGAPSDEDVREFELLRLPAVTLGAYRNCGSLPDISSDAASLGEQMTRHLLARGRRKIMFYDHGPYYLHCAECRNGYLKALQEAGVAPLFLYKEYQIDKPLIDHLDCFFAEHPDTDAVMISTDEVYQYISYLAMHPERKIGSIGLFGPLAPEIITRPNPDFVFCAHDGLPVRAAEMLLDHITTGAPLVSELIPARLGGVE